MKKYSKVKNHHLDPLLAGFLGGLFILTVVTVFTMKLHADTEFSDILVQFSYSLIEISTRSIQYTLILSAFISQLNEHIPKKTNTFYRRLNHLVTLYTLCSCSGNFEIKSNFRKTNFFVRNKKICSK